MIEKLIGKRFDTIWHVLDMLCINLGETLCIDVGERPEFSVRVQCQWRFRKDSEILLASRDMYKPADPDAPDSWYDEHRDGQVDDATLFVSRIPDFCESMTDSSVSSASVSPLGDLRIAFTNDVVFESFTPGSRKEEFWRAIDFQTREHFVMFDIP